MMSTFFRRRVLPRQLAILERIEFSLCSYLIVRTTRKKKLVWALAPSWHSDILVTSRGSKRSTLYGLQQRLPVVT